LTEHTASLNTNRAMMDESQRENSLSPNPLLKLAADIGCEPVSLYFFWQHDLVLGLGTHFVPHIAASLILICCTNFEASKRFKAGAYLQRQSVGKLLMMG